MQRHPGSPRSDSPLGEMLRVAAPAMAAMLSYPVMQFVDSRMVSQLGPEALTAQGNGGMVAYLPVAAVGGLLAVVNTYVAQHTGAGDARRVGGYAWAAIWLSLIIAGLCAPLVFLASPIFSHMGHAQAVVAGETRYAQILVAGIFFAMAARGLSGVFYGLHKSGVVLLATIAGNVINIAANYVLIFGAFGAPKMGLTGAAIGTVLGSIVEFAIPFALLVSPAYAAAYGARRWRPERRALRELLRLGWPSAVQMGNELVCWTLFMVYLIGRLSVIDSAASWIVHRYLLLSFMPAYGLANAVTAIVGRYAGRGDVETAARRAYLGLGVGMLYMGACAALFFFFRAELVGFFLADGTYTEKDAEQILRLGASLMVVAAIFQLFDAMGVVMIGALRGVGDTLWPGLVTAALSWVVIIGGGLLISYAAPGLGALGPWIAACVYIILLGALMLARFRRGRWRGIDLLQSAPAEAPSAARAAADADG